MSIEIIREGHKPDTKLYFTCRCGCVWKADERDREMTVIEYQREYEVIKHHCNCPTCDRKCTGMSLGEYAKFEYAQSMLNFNYNNYTGSGNPNNVSKPNYEDAHFNGEFDKEDNK